MRAPAKATPGTVSEPAPPVAEEVPFPAEVTAEGDTIEVEVWVTTEEAPVEEELATEDDDAMAEEVPLVVALVTGNGTVETTDEVVGATEDELAADEVVLTATARSSLGAEEEEASVVVTALVVSGTDEVKVVDPDWMVT